MRYMNFGTETLLSNKLRSQQEKTNEVY